MSTARHRHPALQLLGRYRAVLKAAWDHRAELQGPRRLADEAAFMPAALSLQESPPHPSPRRLAWAIMILFVLALTWSIVGEVDIVAVAPGRIVVSERNKLVQPLENSVVKAILVRDGDTVKAGQALIELDATAAQADQTSLQEQAFAHQNEGIRARALLSALQHNAEPHTGMLPAGWSREEAQALHKQLDAEWGDIAAKTAKLDAEIARRRAEAATVQAAVAKLETTLPLSRQREEDFRRLAEQGFMANHAGQDRTRERIELERDLALQYARLHESQAGSEESQKAKAAYLAETQRALHERLAQAQLRLHQVVQERAKANQREKLTTLTAPVDGTVQQLMVHTTGGVVTQAQTLMVIVPHAAQMTAEVMLENKDIGFVAVGQEAAIKLETFNYTRYGTVAATVARVTGDAVQDDKRGAIFPVSLQLATPSLDVDGKRIALSPGMNLTAEIKTGKRRVIDYLISPLHKAASEALRER